MDDVTPSIVTGQSAPQATAPLAHPDSAVSASMSPGLGIHRFMGTSFANPANDITMPELAVADPASVWTVVWILSDTTTDAKCW